MGGDESKPVAEIAWADAEPAREEPEPAHTVQWVDDNVSGDDGMSVLATSRKGNLLRFELAASPNRAIRAALMSSNRMIDDAVLVQRVGARTELLVLANKSGRFNVNLFAKNRGPETDYPFVMSIPFEHTVELSNNTRLDRLFPKTFGRFSEEEVFLETPLESPLPPNRAVVFKVRVPGATQAAVAYGEDWTILTRQGDWYSGSVPVPASGDVVLLAQFGDDDFHGLAQYQVGSR